MVGRREGESIGEGLVGLDGLGIGEAFAVAAAEDIHANGKLIAAEFGMVGNLVGINIDEFDDPVGVGAAGGGDEVGDWLALDVKGLGEHIAGVGENVGAARGFALIVDQPLRPGERQVVSDGLAGSRAEGNGPGRVGDVLVVGSGVRGAGGVS